MVPGPAARTFASASVLQGALWTPLCCAPVLAASLVQPVCTVCLVAAGCPVDEIFDFVPVQRVDGLRAAASGAHQHANLVTRRDRIGTQKDVPASEQQVGPHDLLRRKAASAG